MKTLIINNELKAFISFCAKDTEVKNLVANQKDGLLAVDRLLMKMHDLARQYVLEKRKKISFDGHIEMVLIANEIVKKIN